MHVMEERSPAADFTPRRRSLPTKKKRSWGFSYDKLPQEPIGLRVIKLDGTSFQIEVVKTGTVAQLKQAVEAVFSYLPKSGPTKVSWPFVWAHFCLSYNGQILLCDTDEITRYGIRDGDELQFVRHDSISYNMAKDISGSEESSESDFDPSISETRSEASEDEHVDDREVYKRYGNDILENKEEDVLNKNENSPLATGYWLRMASVFKGLASYQRMRGSDELKDVEMTSKGCPSKFSLQ